MANDQAIRRAKTYPFCGRLIVLDTSQGDIRDPYSISNAFSIDFPAMPDQIELARRADYKVINNWGVPDGIHMYMATNPQKIPFSFKLHSMDKDYCKEGALTVLKTAARLHAVVAPLGNSDLRITVQNDGHLDENGGPQPGIAGPGTQPATEHKAGKSTAEQGNQVTDNGAPFSVPAASKVDPPVGVRLEMMYTDNTGPGIVCNGYIEDVRAVLCGPFLRGPGNSFNLPTSGEFSFTFVHRPGHGNWFSNTSGGAALSLQATAYAQLIKERLFNTRDLRSDSRFIGLGTVR